MNTYFVVSSFIRVCAPKPAATSVFGDYYYFYSNSVYVALARQLCVLDSIGRLKSKMEYTYASGMCVSST